MLFFPMLGIADGLFGKHIENWMRELFVVIVVIIFVVFAGIIVIIIINIIVVIVIDEVIIIKVTIVRILVITIYKIMDNNRILIICIFILKSQFSSKREQTKMATEAAFAAHLEVKSGDANEFGTRKVLTMTDIREIWTKALVAKSADVKKVQTSRRKSTGSI